MFQVTRTFTRPSTTIPFFDARSAEGTSDQFKAYFLENYINPGKSLGITHTVSSDGLVLTAISLWDNEESYNQFMADPSCASAVSFAQQYNNDNGITELTETSTI